jgi:hypothetical protein
MLKASSLALALFIASSAHAQIRPAKSHEVRNAFLHLGLGAGVEIGVSQAAGGPQKYGAGLLASGLVAGFKEASDAIAGRDTKKQAIFHALTIVAGAGIAAAAWHKAPNCWSACGRVN